MLHIKYVHILTMCTWTFKKYISKTECHSPKQREEGSRDSSSGWHFAIVVVVCSDQ